MAELIGLAEFAQRMGWTYNRALKAALRGEIKAAKIAGRWLLLVPDQQDAEAPPRAAPTPTQEK